MSVLLQDKRNTKQEFKRLKTILPSIRRKENVSKLDIILEAIKYIDDLQDQLIDRLSGPRSEREATLLALTTQESGGVDDTDRLREFGDNDDEMFFDRHEGDEDEEEDLISLSDGYMSDPGLLMIYQDQEDQEGSEPEDEDDCSSGISHASLELWSDQKQIIFEQQQIFFEQNKQNSIKQFLSKLIRSYVKPSFWLWNIILTNDGEIIIESELDCTVL